LAFLPSLLPPLLILLGIATTILVSAVLIIVNYYLVVIPGPELPEWAAICTILLDVVVAIAAYEAFRTWREVRKRGRAS
jgi:hypothetical protein